MNSFKMMVLLFLSISFSSTAADIGLRKNQPFTEARIFLLSSKWKPLKVHSTKDDYLNSNVNEDLVKLGFIEAFACSVDTSNCDFFYKKNGKCLRVDAVGEEIKYMKIVRWSEECPPRE